MRRTANFLVNVLLFRETCGHDSAWIAHCIEYDIAAYGGTVEEATDSFKRTFIGEIAIDIEHGLNPLERIPQAPRPIRDMFAKMNLD